MIVELIGCTGAGKSTVFKSMLQVCREMKIEASGSDVFILRKIHLNNIKNYYSRVFLIDIISLLMCLYSSRKHFKLYSLVLKILQNSPASIRFFEKLNILRNTFKQIGIYEFARRYNSTNEIIMMDEGTLHTAHYLFVNISVAPDTEYFSAFVSLVPLPDVIVHIQENDEILMKRTMKRGHKRIPDTSRVVVERFIKHAVYTFDKLTQFPVVKSRLITVEGTQQINNFQKNQNFSQHVDIQNILKSSLDAINTSYIIENNQSQTSNLL